MKQPFTMLLCVGLTVSCSGDMPMSGDGLMPHFGVAGRSGCYAVVGTISETGEPPLFAGTISGDLQGTTVAEVQGSSSTGPVNHNEVAFTYAITGGIVPELVGEYVQISASRVTTTYTRDNPDIGRVSGSLTVESPGSGHLTLHGSVDIAGFPLVIVALEYHGVVCP